MIQISERLIKWYQKNKRILPWRETSDPYKIWLSEVILQQTRIDQGLPYYIKFVENFPSISDLAHANEDRVLKLWQGLGYYSRARNLHATAKQIVNEYNSHFPADYHQLLSLKGIGEYTAAAIASFAFDLPHAVLDGNVFRVLSRLYGIETPINSHQGKKEFTILANNLLDHKKSHLYNQAIMDFGSIVCKPSNPDCLNCVFSEDCIAFRKDWVIKLPVKIKNKPVQKRYFNYLFLVSGNKLMLTQRTQTDIWKNLYDLPLIESDKLFSTDEITQSNLYQSVNKQNSLTYVNSIDFIHKLTHREIHARYHIFLYKKLETLNKLGIFETKFTELKKFGIPRLLDKFLNFYFETDSKKTKTYKP